MQLIMGRQILIEPKALNSSDILNSEENTTDTNEFDQPSTLKLTDY